MRESSLMARAGYTGVYMFKSTGLFATLRSHKIEAGDMKPSTMTMWSGAALAVLTLMVAWPGSSFAVDNKIFRMVASSATCVPGAAGRVTIATPNNQNLHV